MSLNGDMSKRLSVRYAVAVHGASQSSFPGESPLEKSRSISPQLQDAKAAVPVALKVKDGSPVHDDASKCALPFLCYSCKGPALSPEPHDAYRRMRSPSPQRHDAWKASAPAMFNTKDDGQTRNSVDVRQMKFPSTSCKVSVSSPQQHDGYRRLRSPSPQPHDAFKTSSPVMLTRKEDGQPRSNTDVKQIRVPSRSCEVPAVSTQPHDDNRRMRSPSPQPHDAWKAAAPVILSTKDVVQPRGSAVTKQMMMPFSSCEVPSVTPQRHDRYGRMRSPSPQPHDAWKAFAPVILSAKDAGQPVNDVDIKKVRMPSRSCEVPGSPPQPHDRYRRMRSPSPHSHDAWKASAPAIFTAKYAGQNRNDADVKKIMMPSRSYEAPAVSPQPHDRYGRMRSPSPQPRDAWKAVAQVMLTTNDDGELRTDADAKQTRMPFSSCEGPIFSTQPNYRYRRMRSHSPQPCDAWKVPPLAMFTSEKNSQPRDDADIKQMTMPSRSQSVSPRLTGVLQAAPVTLNVKDGSSPCADIDINAWSALVRASSPCASPRTQNVFTAMPTKINQGSPAVKDVCPSPLMMMRSIAGARSTPQRGGSRCGTPLKLARPPQDVLRALTQVAWNATYAGKDADVPNLRMRSRSRSASVQPSDALPRSLSASPERQDFFSAVVPAAVPVAMKLNAKIVRHNHYDTANRRVRPRANSRVLCYGDSNTAGWCSGGKKFEPYARSLEQALLSAGVVSEVSHDGLSGVTASEMAEKLDQSIRDTRGLEHEGLRKLIHRYRPDVVIIMVGTNDFAKERTPLQIVQDTSRLHVSCHEDGIETIALAPPSAVDGPVRQCRDKYASLLKQFASINPKVATYRDVEAMLPRGPLGYWDPDVIHLSAAGSWALGQQLAPLVMQCSKISEQSHHALRHEFGGA